MTDVAWSSRSPTDVFAVRDSVIRLSSTVGRLGRRAPVSRLVTTAGDGVTNVAATFGSQCQSPFDGPTRLPVTPTASRNRFHRLECVTTTDRFTGGGHR